MIVIEQIDIDINVNSNSDALDELTSKIAEATSEAENLGSELDNITVGDVGADEISSELADATTEADELQSSLDEIGNTTISPEINIDNSSLDETKEKMEEIENTGSSLGTALTGLAGMIGVDQIISAADNISMRANRTKLIFGEAAKSIEDSAKSAATATGRSVGEATEYFQKMGIAGVKNEELLNKSFESLAGAAVKANVPLGQAQGAMQRMVMTGNVSGKTLQNLGLTTEDLGAALGVTAGEATSAFSALSQEERVEALTKAMGDGAQANEMYKNSYAGLKAQAENAMAGLMAAVGEGTLPIINPLIQGATSVVKGLSGAFKALPGPVKGVVGAFGGFLAVGTTSIGVLGMIGSAGSKVVSGLSSLSKGMQTAKLMVDALRNAESIAAGVKKAYEIATNSQTRAAAAEAAAEAANTGAKTAAITPTAILTAITDSLALSMIAVAIPVIALIAALWYLYNTNEGVRNSIDWVISSVTSFANGLIPAAMGVINFVTKLATSFGKIPGAIDAALKYAIIQVGIWAINMVSKGVQAAHNFVNSVRSALSGIGSAVSGALSGVYNFLTAPFRQAYNFINSSVIQPLKDAWGWLSGAFSGFEGFEGYAGLDDTLNSTISNISNNQSSSNNMTVNNNFNGLVEESAAEYIVNAVNDRLRREKLLSGGI